jgi:hypothetical protein
MAEDVAALLADAVRGDEGAWRQLVIRFTPLVRSVISRYGLNRADTADVNQTLWLRLVEHLGNLREPAALPKWIIMTTSHECLREGIAGQLSPAQVGRAQVTGHSPDGTFDRAYIDELGYFVLKPPPAGPVHLHCRSAVTELVTDWVSLTEG